MPSNHFFSPTMVKMPWEIVTTANTAIANRQYCRLVHTSTKTKRETIVDVVVRHEEARGIFIVDNLSIGCASVAQMFKEERHNNKVAIIDVFVKQFDLTNNLWVGLSYLLGRYNFDRAHFITRNEWQYVKTTRCDGGIIRTIMYTHRVGPIYVNLKMAGTDILDLQVTTERHDSMFDSFIEGVTDGFINWLGRNRSLEFEEMIHLLSTNSIQPRTSVSRPSSGLRTVYKTHVPGAPPDPRPSGHGNNHRPSSPSRPSGSSRPSGQRGGKNTSPWVSTGRRATLKDGSRRTVFRNDRGEERVRRKNQNRNQKQGPRSVYVRFEEARQ